MADGWGYTDDYHDWTTGIVRDSRGFIWFCTTEGLSRFDGYRFVNYTIDDGLPFHSINDLLEETFGLGFFAFAGGFDTLSHQIL